MVSNSSLRAKTVKSALKPILPILILFILVFILILLSSCKTNLMESRSVFKITETPNELFVKDRLKDGVFLAVNKNFKDIFEYNVKNNTYNGIIKTKNSDKYIKSVACNTQWVVWVEDESLIMNTSSKPFKWEMIAQNISTSERIVIDKSEFNSNKFDVPLFINYTPDQIAISSDNVVVYCRNKPNNSQVASELVLYDLNNRILKSIATTDNVNNELIANCSIYLDKIVWSKYRELNDDFNFRYTQYKYSDMFLHDINTGMTEQLTNGDFYHNPCMYEDKLVAVCIPRRKANEGACNSEIVLLSIKSKDIKVIADKDSPHYIAREVYRSNPKINDKHISWYNGGFDNRYVYDYNADNFIEVHKKQQDGIATIYNMFDNYVFLYINLPEKEPKKICIEL